MTAKFKHLGENHARGIRSMLICLDNMLAEFEMYANGREVASVMVVERNTLDQAEREHLQDEVNRMRGVMQRIKDDLGLVARESDLRREICARSSGVWEMLLENDSKRLRRYGAMDGAFAVYWRKQWEELVNQLKRISAIGSGDRAGDGQTLHEHEGCKAGSGERSDGGWP